MQEVVVLESIADISPNDWNACFPDGLESYEYLLAVEESGIKDFSWRYAIVLRDGHVVAAAPGFVTTYALDTTLTGWSKQLLGSLRRMAPGALTLKLACIGSPCTETSTIGFAPDMPPSQHVPLLRALTQGFEADVRTSGAGLLAIKDTLVSNHGLWDDAFTPLGYSAVPGMPVATLDISFDSIESYLARLSAGTRKDMRRKLRLMSDVAIEETCNIDHVLDQVYKLYQDTLRRAELQFEELTPAYFSNVLRTMPDKAFCKLYYSSGDLIGFNLLIDNGETLLDKFFCMDGVRGRDLNLYFLSWFTNVSYCIEHSLNRYQSGQAGYENKLRLGSKLEPTSMYFRHRSRAISRTLQFLAPIFLSAPDFIQVPL